MTDEDWNKGYVRSLGLRLAGDAIEERDEKGRPILDDTLLVLLNAHHEQLPFTLPAHKRSVRWEMILDTAAKKQGMRKSPLLRGGTPYNLHARSLVILRLQREQTDEHLSSMKSARHKNIEMTITASRYQGGFPLDQGNERHPVGGFGVRIRLSLT
jgi:glycogen operon protein